MWNTLQTRRAMGMEPPLCDHCACVFGASPGKASAATEMIVLPELWNGSNTPKLSQSGLVDIYIYIYIYILVYWWLWFMAIPTGTTERFIFLGLPIGSSSFMSHSNLGTTSAALCRWCRSWHMLEKTCALRRMNVWISISVSNIYSIDICICANIFYVDKLWRPHCDVTGIMMS